ncbi:hypothetical protein LUZ60_011192 [Juncus effusus]|nr:hypothetical protein LUZ60_011192 [Juncus effusus]
MILEGGEMGEIMGGYFIKKFVSPKEKLRILSSVHPMPKRNNKENVNPVNFHVAGQNTSQHQSQSRSRRSRSVYPDWFPRTPLRYINNVIDRRRTIPAQAPITCAARAQHQTPITANRIRPSRSDPTDSDRLTPVKMLYTPELKVYETALTESIDELERIAKRNLKREKKKKMKSNTTCVSSKRVRALVSMR